MFDSPLPPTDRLLSSRTIQAVSYPSALLTGPDDPASQPIGGVDANLKRAADIVIALIGLIVLAPFMALIALLIRLDSHGPALFQQTRTGFRDRPFQMFKFRTMVSHDDAPGGFQQAARRDPRVTRTGAWLRRTSLDELPQLMNVLLGDMAIVGPRPHVPGTRAAGRRFEDVTARYAMRHWVKPGMTGLAQVRGWRGETETEEKLLRRVDCDLEYIATWSFTLDLRIMVRTVAAVLLMRNAY